MASYRLAGQDFYFPYLLPELNLFEIADKQPGTASSAVPFFSASNMKRNLIAHTEGWVAGAERTVETWSVPPGLLLKVAGASDFYISPDGLDILCAGQEQGSSRLNEVDRKVLLGPVMVLALSLRGAWSLHASAAIFHNNLVLFLGESGQGKSTLSAYLANLPGWRLVADDILPVTITANGVVAWPHFPQLKLPMQAQPGPGLPEQLAIGKVCVLSDAGADDLPALQRCPNSKAVQVYLGHTAGSRLFDPDLLARHLAFCSRATEKVPVYNLAYPHRLDALPMLKGLLENLC